MAFNNDGLGPSNFFNYSDGTTHTTVALTRADYPPASNANIWYPANGVSDGYASEPLAYSLGFQKVLQEVIYSPGGTPVSSNAADPWIIGWAANAIHGSDSIHNGGVDLNGHPLSEIINWPANSSLPDNLEMTTLGGLFGAVQVPITCPGHSQSAMSAATDFELITMANTCANRYLENLDLSLGTLLDSLAPRVLRNTYVIFTADNTSQPNSGSNYDSGFPSNYVFDTQVAMALSGNTGTAPTGVCEYTWGPNANSAVQVTANMRCGKGHAFQRFENEFSVPFVIAHGRIPKHLRGNTSHVRMRTPDITETIISMATYGEPEATIVQATDGNDITSVWGVGADPADFTSPYHQLNTGTVQIGTVDASITSTDCRGDIAVLDPNSLGEVYRLIRSECREDYIQNLTSATPFTDLRPIANPAGTAEGIRVFAAWESLIDLIDARQLAGLGLNSGGQTPTNAGPNTGEGPIVP